VGALGLYVPLAAFDMISVGNLVHIWLFELKIHIDGSQAFLRQCKAFPSINCKKAVFSIIKNGNFRVDKCTFLY